MRPFLVTASLGAFHATTGMALAQDHCDEACQAVRKAQDPLAAVRALLTDNTIGYGPTGADTTYSYQLQPVYTFEGENANVIVRGLIPYIGVPNGAGGTDYGWSDSAVQMFYVPEVEPGSLKLGYRVQLSFDTAQDARFSGPGWRWSGSTLPVTCPMAG